MSEIVANAARMMELLPDREKSFAYEFIKKLVKAWDPDFTEEAEHFEFATMITRKKSISKFVVSTMKHFVCIIKNGRANRNAAVNNVVKMVIEDFLNNTHN